MNFAKDIATYLNANTSLVLGTNLFYNTELKDNDVVPDFAVFIYSYVTRQADRCFGSNKEVRYPRVIIAVRSNVEGSVDGLEIETAYNLTETIYSTLQSSSITGYEDVKFLRSQFEKQGKDKQNRHMWSNRIEGFYNQA